MLKKDITYQNLDGQDVTETFYFQITKAEVIEKAAIKGEDYADRLRKLTVERDGAEIMREFKALLTESVGRREGQLFIKDESIRNQFLFSGAWDSFFLKLIESPDSGAKELQSIFPKDVQDQIAKEAAGQTTELPVSGEIVDAAAPAQPGKDDEPAWFKEKREPTGQELRKMSKDELSFLFKVRETGALAA